MAKPDYCNGPDCWACQIVRMGEIGHPQKEIEFEPFPATEPIKEPAAPSVVPSEPVPA